MERHNEENIQTSQRFKSGNAAWSIGDVPTEQFTVRSDTEMS